MKKRILVLSLLACFLTVAFAGSIVKDFRGEPGVNKVILRWKAESESNLKGYEVERSFDKNLWDKVGFVDAKGAGAGVADYTYEDRTVFKPNDRVFHYRLRIVDQGNTFTYFGEVVTVSPFTTTVRQTWGSIKAMFR